MTRRYCWRVGCCWEQERCTECGDVWEKHRVSEDQCGHYAQCPIHYWHGYSCYLSIGHDGGHLPPQESLNCQHHPNNEPQNEGL